MTTDSWQHLAMGTSDYESVWDQLGEEFAHHYGGRNLRREAIEFRGRYLTLWTEVELQMDTVITEYLEVPRHKQGEMMDGFLPLIASARTKVEFIRIIARRVAPESEAPKKCQAAQELRNKLAHRRASTLSHPDLVQNGALVFSYYKHGDPQQESISPTDAFRTLREADDALDALLRTISPGWSERVREEARQFLEETDG